MSTPWKSDFERLTTRPAGTHRRVLFASLVGTSIEYFDFYAYATAAVLVFPELFFPRESATSATLQSFATFALAFFARPLGATLFGHFGDRVGRKATLVSALATMGVATVIIGMLPTYASIGVLAPALLALCRLGQGLGLGGEWGGAVLLATENAPAHEADGSAALDAPKGCTCYVLITQEGTPKGCARAGLGCRSPLSRSTTACSTAALASGRRGQRARSAIRCSTTAGSANDEMSPS